jgi:hypothetical protein
MEMKKMSLRQKLDFITLCSWLGQEFLGAQSTEEVLKALEDIKNAQVQRSNQIASQLDESIVMVEEFQRRSVNE